MTKNDERRKVFLYEFAQLLIKEFDENKSFGHKNKESYLSYLMSIVSKSTGRQEECKRIRISDIWEYDLNRKTIKDHPEKEYVKILTYNYDIEVMIIITESSRSSMPGCLHQKGTYLSKIRFATEAESHFFRGEQIRGKVDLKIRYFDNQVPKLSQTIRGDLIDLYNVNILKETSLFDGWKQESIESRNKDFRNGGYLSFKEGDTIYIGHGFAISAPQEYRFNISPRSGTFKKYGLMLTNSPGAIDNSFNGTNDEIKTMWYATRDGELFFKERICQMELVKRQPLITFHEVDALEDTDRGGYGTSGR